MVKPKTLPRRWCDGIKTSAPNWPIIHAKNDRIGDNTVIICGKWINGGSTFRVWYVVHGKVKVVDADGATSWQIENAMRRSAALVNV